MLVNSMNTMGFAISCIQFVIQTNDASVDEFTIVESQKVRNVSDRDSSEEHTDQTTGARGRVGRSR